MPRDTDVLILGGGPAGIAAALELGEDALLLERAETLGGLSVSLEIDGAIMDLGGHSFHTPHRDVHQMVFNALEMESQTRNAQCFFRGDLIPYPFQQSFRQLNQPDVIDECERGLADVVPGAQPETFEDHIRMRFGPGISKHFMEPYNRKLWGEDLRRLAVEWTAERVASVERKAKDGILSGGTRKPLQSNTTVAYPAQGGFGEIFKALGRQVRLFETGVTVQRVDTVNRVVEAACGAQYRYENLVSTLPLPRLLQICDGVPRELLDQVARLDALGLTLVFVVVDHPIDTDIQRIYCSEPDILAHKITLNHASSNSLRSRPVHGVVAEISDARPRAVQGDDLLRKVVCDLQTVGVIGRENEVKSAKAMPIPNAYPSPTLHRAGVVAQCKAWLAERGIQTLGRFGEWAYINCDEAMHRGVQAGRRLKDL